VILEAFLSILDSASGNDALQVLLSRNDISTKKGRKAFTEVMHQLVHLAVRNKRMLPFFGRFPSVSLASALAILDGTVDIQVQVQTKASEAMHLLALHLKSPILHVCRPTNWPPTDGDVVQLAAGNYEAYDTRERSSAVNL